MPIDRPDDFIVLRPGEESARVVSLDWISIPDSDPLLCFQEVPLGRFRVAVVRTTLDQGGVYIDGVLRSFPHVYGARPFRGIAISNELVLENAAP